MDVPVSFLHETLLLAAVSTVSLFPLCCFVSAIQQEKEGNRQVQYSNRQTGGWDEETGWACVSCDGQARGGERALVSYRSGGMKHFTVHCTSPGLFDLNQLMISHWFLSQNPFFFL